MALPNEAIDARVGTVVDDQFRVTRFIGSGGTGLVYEAEHTVRAQRVAIKFTLPEYAANREAVRRFQNEAKSAGHLDHENIVAVLDQGSTPDGTPYVVMEYLTGQDCGQLLSSSGPLPIERACDIVCQACVGMSAAHQSGIVHRDLKPANLFITRALDGTDLVKILDFGVAKLRVPANSTLGGSDNETLCYRAPEQVRSAGRVDGRADIWALGVILYELLTAQRPFDGPDANNIVYQISFEEPEPPDEVRRGLPPELASTIELALDKDPEKRFETVLALAEAIGPFTGRPQSKFSKLAVSQRPPLLTPVDAAYDTTQPGVSVLTNAPVSRSLTTSRQRAYRVYTMLGLAALVGFGGGALARRVVNHHRALAAVAERDYREPLAERESAAVASEEPPTLASAIGQVANDARLRIVPAAPASANGSPSTSAAPVAAPSQTQNAPMRLVRASPDGGTLRAMVERTEGAPGTSPAANAKKPDMALARAKAPSASVPATESSAPVPTKPESERAPATSTDENPL